MVVPISGPQPDSNDTVPTHSQDNIVKWKSGTKSSPPTHLAFSRWALPLITEGRSHGGVHLDRRKKLDDGSNRIGLNEVDVREFFEQLLLLEAALTTDDAEDLVIFVMQKGCKVTTVLPGDR